MVLINNLTIDEINAALLHLQRSQGEVVGGEKGTTIQNISLRNEGGTSGTDYSDAISKINETLDEHEKELSEMGVTDAKMQTQLDRLAGMVENLSTSGINSVSFDDDTRTLSIELTDGQVYEVNIPQDDVTLSFDDITNVITLVVGDQTQTITLPYINASEKGEPYGVATLDDTGRIPYSQLPESAMEFLGQWDAATNTPHLEDGTGTNGDFYVCNVGGTVTFGTGNTETFVPNDRVIYNGIEEKWERLPAGAVSSVNGQSGAVVLTANDIEYSTGVSIKQKIDNNAPMQSDWNETCSTCLSYIKNKPVLGSAACCDVSCFRASTWTPNMNDVSDATNVGVAQNAVCRKIIMTNMINNVGYITRVGIGLERGTTGWGTALFSVGKDDCGTSFYDYKFTNTGVLTAACFCGDLCGMATCSLWAKNNCLRPTSASIYAANNSGGLTHFLATSSMTTDKPARDGHIIHMSWDNTGGYSAQFFIANNISAGCVPQYRAENGGTWSAWKNFITEDNIASQTVNCATCSFSSCYVNRGAYSNNYNWHLLFGYSNAAATCSGVYVSCGCPLTFNPSTGVLTANYFCGTVCGNVCGCVCVDSICTNWVNIPNSCICFYCCCGSDGGTNWFFCCAKVDKAHCRGQLEVWNCTNLDCSTSKRFCFLLPPAYGSIKGGNVVYCCGCWLNTWEAPPLSYRVCANSNVIDVTLRQVGTCKLYCPHFIIDWWY